MTIEDRASVRVAGTGRAGRPADLAQAVFVAESIRESAADARSVAAVIAETVIAALHGAGVAAADGRTSTCPPTGSTTAPGWFAAGSP
jgi:uncharacterized protein YggE